MADKQDSTIKTLARNIQANPDDSFSKFALALEFLKKNNLQRAKLLFEDIYRSDPAYVGVYYHLGKLYERLDHLDKAKTMYNEGIDIASNQDEHRTQKELQEALAQLETEIEDQ